MSQELHDSPYNELWARVNKIKVRLKDRFRGSNVFPIGTRKPITHYDPNEDIPEEEIKFFQLDTVQPNNSTSVLLIGQAGTFKTTLVKTLTHYNNHIPNTRIGIFSLKESSLDWAKVNKPKKNPGMLYPDEPQIMKIEAGCPSFALSGLTNKDRRKIKVMNLPPKEFADLDVLTGLGFSPVAKQHLYKMMKEGMSPMQIQEKIERMYQRKKLPKPSYDNVSILMDNMMRNEFFAKKGFFDINEIWNDNTHWALGFNNKAPSYLSVYVDKILSQVFDRANSSVGQKERYWIVVDDALKAFGLNRDKFPSVQRGIDSLSLWRSVGINMVIGVQTPTMLDEEIYSDIKHFFIYRCANVHVLAKYIPNRQILNEVKTLVFQPENYISECIHVFPDRYRYERFFPFNSPIAN